MSILSPNQRNILDLISKDGMIGRSFYLTGGTALAEFYLDHRLSEDLDFFSEKEFDPQSISTFFAKIKKNANIKTVSIEQSFNRSLFFLSLEDEKCIKTEFTHFPFPQIEKGKRINEMNIDSLVDIAVNKVFTIYQNPRLRDFIDLFCILEKEKEWTISNLVEKVRIKFDHHIDPIQLSAQFVKVEMLKDYPKMIKNIPEKIWQDFFMSQAGALSKSQIN